MADFPGLTIWTDAFLADTMGLDATETGAYLMLLMCAWRTNECRLPDDDKKLARFARCTDRQWKKVGPVIREFFYVEDNFLYQKRLLEERKKVIDKREGNVLGGSTTAIRKSLKNNKTGSGQPPVDQQSTTNQAGRSTSSHDPLSNIQDPIKKEEDKSSSKEKRSKRMPVDAVFDQNWLNVGKATTAKAGNNLTDHDLENLFYQMRDWSQADKNGAKLDWVATYRTWVRRQRPPPRAATGHRQDAINDKWDQAFDQLQERVGT